jgi:hypothetical protein
MALNRLPAPTERKPHSLDHLPLTKRYLARFAADNELPELASLVERYIPGISNGLESARRVRNRHPECMFAILHKNRIVGAVAALYLNSAGLAQLRSGTFSFGAPNVDFLTLPGEPIAAIYAWALCLPSGTSVAMGNVMQWLQRPLYRQADIFARPATAGGMRFMRDMGFIASDFRTPDLWVYQRRPRSNFENFNYGLDSIEPIAERGDKA